MNVIWVMIHATISTKGKFNIKIDCELEFTM